VVWQGLRSELTCHNRDDVLHNVSRGCGNRPAVAGIELPADHDRVLFGVRSPELTERFDQPLAGAIYNDFTIHENLIARIHVYADRDTAASRRS
jgi:hypothetical protein